MSQILDLWESHPMFRWGMTRGLQIGIFIGVLLGIALVGVALLIARA